MTNPSDMQLVSATFPIILTASLFTAAKIILAIWLFVRKLPHRNRFALRAVVVFAVVLVAVVAGSWVGTIQNPSLTTSNRYLAQAAVFIPLPIACLAATAWLYDASPWTLLFCVTAGYTLQNIASSAETFNWLLSLVLTGGVSEPFAALDMLVTPLVIYVVGYLVLVRRIEREGLELIQDRKMLLMILALLALVIGFDLVNKQLEEIGTPVEYVIILRIFHFCVCMFMLLLEYEMLYSKSLKTEVATMSRVMEGERRHLELSRESIQAINARCHDIRHQVLKQLTRDDSPHDRETLTAIAREISIYDSQVKTGNETLDVVITEKGLLCEREGISLSCIADGSALSFMSATDIYALFGTVLGDAMDAAQANDDLSCRRIVVNVHQAMGFVSTHIEYPASGAAERDASVSLRLIVESYGGTLEPSEKNGVRRVDILFPANPRS